MRDNYKEAVAEFTVGKKGAGSEIRCMIPSVMDNSGSRYELEAMEASWYYMNDRH